MLRAMNIEKIFHDGIRDDLHVLNDINFSLDRAETSAIIGSSGSGKTTLLNILGGLDKPSAGKVLLNEVDVHKLSEKQRCTVRNEHFGFIYQFHHLLPEFTALENAAMPLLIKGSNVEQSKQQAEKVLADVGLSKRLHHKPSELSGGERQRAAIARALIHQPDCILADEPTGNLDRKNAEQAIDLIINLNKDYRTSLVIVTHDLKIAQRMDKIYTLEDGILKNA
ncbi:MAG: ATP-binding cassette domain-containing protein [Gammaproteobacteria bacterium]|nr:ATP-binding cassette domain-containing protein [Gammaproteobacteria bacterium]MBT8133596.1 ATP-binding cassette domain-containing protein [Gammaproteobacteria bacterium]NNJ49079.1 ATP-binding cassette domain-containing protein [Gammaproteobacteria bacterium]